ncbi:MAG TPA: tyrosine-protein phosphatase [Tetragenococcus sp.]|nr:tyrosine-protein phosphatase [Tetragenococcus sp.]
MDSITNFRDLGGIKTQDNKEVAANKLLRSGELSRVSLQDQKALLEDYHLGKIIDLRSLAEVQERPDKIFAQTAYQNIDIFKNIHNQGTSMADFKQLMTPETAHGYMSKTYQIMALNPDAQAGFRQVIEGALATDPDKSFLFHCFAGKDRTGISAALLLEILKVPRDSIYQDYLLTNQLRLKENEAVISQAIKNEGVSPQNVESLKVALNVDSHYLDTFYQTVDKEFGGIENYLSQELKIDSQMQKDLQELYLTDAK